MKMFKRNKLTSKIVSLLILIGIFSVWAMPAAQVYAGEVCCDYSTMRKVRIETPGSPVSQVKVFNCYNSSHGGVTPVEHCTDTTTYKHVIYQCQYCGFIWSNTRVETGMTHSNPHH